MKSLTSIATAIIAFSVTGCQKDKEPEFTSPVLTTGLDFGPYPFREKAKASTEVRVKHFEQKLHWIVSIKPTKGNGESFEKLAKLFVEEEKNSAPLFHYVNKTIISLEDERGFKVGQISISDYIEQPATRLTNNEGKTVGLEFSGNFQMEERTARMISDCSILTQYSAALESALISETQP